MKGYPRRRASMILLNGGLELKGQNNTFARKMIQLTRITDGGLGETMLLTRITEGSSHLVIFQKK